MCFWGIANTPTPIPTAEASRPGPPEALRLGRTPGPAVVIALNGGRREPASPRGVRLVMPEAIGSFHGRCGNAAVPAVLRDLYP